MEGYRLYGGRPADYTADASGAPRPNVALEVYVGRGGTRVTDLRDLSDNPTSVAVTSSTGHVLIQAPEGLPSKLYVLSLGQYWKIDADDVEDIVDELKLAYQTGGGPGGGFTLEQLAEHFVPLDLAVPLAGAGQDPVEVTGSEATRGSSAAAARADHGHGLLLPGTADDAPVGFDGVATIPVMHDGVLRQAQFSYVLLDGSGGTLPGAPTGLTASPGNGQVGLTWSAPSAGSGTITTYVVQYRTPAGSGTWTTFSHAPSTATSITVTGLTNDSEYEFRVAAVTGVGTGPFSSTDTATPDAGGSGGGITFDWTAGLTGWTQSAPSYPVEISSGYLYNPAGLPAQYGGVTRDFDVLVDEAQAGRLSLVALGEVGASPGQPSGTSLYVAATASPPTTSGVLYWTEQPGAKSQFISYAPTETVHVNDLPEILVGDVLEVDIEPGAGTSGGCLYTPIINGNPYDGTGGRPDKRFTGPTGSAAWTHRGAFLKGLTRCGTIGWEPA